MIMVILPVLSLMGTGDNMPLVENAGSLPLVIKR